MKNNKTKIAIIAPFPPPFGGMTVLAETLNKSLKKHKQSVITIDTNPKVFGNKKGIIYKFLQLIVFVYNLRKIINYDYYIIISSSGNYFYTKALPVLLIGKIFKKRVVLDFVGGGVIDMINNGNTRIIYWIKKFNQVIVPTTIFKDAFEKVGISSKIFPHIVNISRFSEAKTNTNTPVFLAAKNLEKYSNVASLIRAFAEIKKIKPKATFLIAGDGPEKKNLINLVNELNVSGVEFLGNKSYDEMPKLFSEATIFLHGTQIESFGIVLIEAMASKTPIISTNVGGIPNIITHDYNGLLVNFDDYMSISKLAIELINDNEKYNRITNNALETSKKYSIDILTPKLISLIQETK